MTPGRLLYLEHRLQHAIDEPGLNDLLASWALLHGKDVIAEIRRLQDGCEVCHEPSRLTAEEMIEELLQIASNS